MGHFSDFLAIFQYNFGDSRDIHGMRPIILGYFFPTITMEISTFHFRTSIIQGGFSKFSINFYRAYESGVVVIDITMACDIYLVCFFSTKTMGVMKIHLWASCGKIRPLLRNYPVTFVPGSAHCSSALCLLGVKE